MKQSNNQVGEKYWCWVRDNWGRQCWRRWFRRSHSAMVPLALLCQGDPVDKQSKRRSSIHQQLADAGARFIPVDIAGSSVAALKDQFHGFDTIINCMGFVAGAGTQIKITRAVLEAGVKRYFPCQFGVNYDVVGKGSGQPVWDEQYDVRTLFARAKRHRVGDCFNWYIYLFSLRTSLWCGQLSQNHQCPRWMGNAGHRHVACGYWSPDH